MKREHLPYRYMGQFKAFFADFEFYLSLSDKPVSVCLTERQMYILSVWNSYTPWITRWYNAEDTSSAQLALIAAEIEDLLMCGCGVPQPSFTDRVTSQTYTTTNATNYTTTYNTWNTGGQTVVSIAPNLDHATGDPGDIDKLLCQALPLFVKAIAESAKNIKQGEVADTQDLTKQLTAVFGGLATAGGAGIAVGGTAAAVVGFFGGPWLVLGLALAAVGTGIATLVTQADTAVFDDTEAINDVVCTIVNNTAGSNLTQASFSGSLVPNDFAPESNAAILSGIINAYLADTDTYLQFMVAANQLYDAMDIAALPDCGCDDGWWLARIFENVPDSLKLIAEDADTQTYEMKTYYTGHYLTGGAIAAPGTGAFYILDVSAVGAGTDARFVLDFGTYELDDVPCEYATVKIWIYNAIAGATITVVVSHEGCTEGEWTATTGSITSSEGGETTFEPASETAGWVVEATFTEGYGLDMTSTGYIDFDEFPLAWWWWDENNTEHDGTVLSPGIMTKVRFEFENDVPVIIGGGEIVPV